MQVITASRPEWIVPFTGLKPGQFRTLVTTVAERGGPAIADGRRGRPWSLALADRVLLVATYWRTNLTMRQIGPLFGVSHSAAHRVIDTLGPLLALAPVRRRRVDQVTIVDGTLVPTRDHRMAAPSKNYRYSTNLQVAIDADTRLVIAPGTPTRQPQRLHRLPRLRHRPEAGRSTSDGRWRLPRRPRGDHAVPQTRARPDTDWQEDRNAVHRRVRARVEHALARMKTWKILRDYRRAASTLTVTASGIAYLHNITSPANAERSRPRNQPQDQ